jgi:hypothetical protein
MDAVGHSCPMRLTTCQMGALAGKARSSGLLAPRPEGVLCIRGRLLAAGSLVLGRAVVGLLVGSHVVVQITPVLGRGGRIVGVWGGHDIPSACAGPGARTDAAVGHGSAADARGACAQPSVCTLGMFPAKRFSQCSRAHGWRLAAFQQRVCECDHACAGCSNGRCRGTLAAAMTAATGEGGDWAQSGTQVWSKAVVIQNRGPCSRGGIPGVHRSMVDGRNATETRCPCCRELAVVR